MIVARKGPCKPLRRRSDTKLTWLFYTFIGAKKIKTLEPATAAFPNGINDLVAAAELLSNMSEGSSNSEQALSHKYTLGTHSLSSQTSLHHPIALVQTRGNVTAAPTVTSPNPAEHRLHRGPIPLDLQYHSPSQMSRMPQVHLRLPSH